MVSASRLYLHASSSCGSTGVHGLDVTGFAASDHEAPAHSITNNLGAKNNREKKKKGCEGKQISGRGDVKVLEEEWLTGKKKRKKRITHILKFNPRVCA